MNEEVGALSFPRQEGAIKPYSDHTAELMDAEVRKIVQGAYQRTVKLLSEKKDNLQKVAQLLLEKEVIRNEDLVNLLGARTWQRDTAYLYQQ